jgi:hypothetical protein
MTTLVEIKWGILFLPDQYISIAIYKIPENNSFIIIILKIISVY